MITHVSYREARLKGATATEAAIDTARTAGWSVSEVREMYPGQFAVIFRYDSDGEAEDTTTGRRLPELPVFEEPAPRERYGPGLAGVVAGPWRLVARWLHRLPAPATRGRAS